MKRRITIFVRPVADGPGNYTHPTTNKGGGQQ